MASLVSINHNSPDALSFNDIMDGRSLDTAPMAIDMGSLSLRGFQDMDVKGVDISDMSTQLRNARNAHYEPPVMPSMQNYWGSPADVATGITTSVLDAASSLLGAASPSRPAPGVETGGLSRSFGGMATAQPDQPASRAAMYRATVLNSKNTLS